MPAYLHIPHKMRKNLFYCGYEDQIKNNLEEIMN